jgi:hypothetical protein
MLFSLDVDDQSGLGQLGLGPLGSASYPGELGLLGGGLGWSGPRSEAGQRTGVTGTAPLHQVRGVQPLSSQKGTLVAVPDAAVVLGEDLQLEVSGEGPPPGSVERVRVGAAHGYIMGALHREGHGQVSPSLAL